MTEDVPWYHGLLSWADGLARPVLSRQRLKVQKRAYETRPDARPIILHNHSRNNEEGEFFPGERSDDDVGSFDAHQSMTDIAKACKDGVAQCVLMTEHGLTTDEAEFEIKCAERLNGEYGTEFIIGSEIGTYDGGAGGHVIYVPSRQNNIFTVIDEWESTDDRSGILKLAKIAYDNGDFLMVPHPGKGDRYDSFERYLRIEWRLKKKDISALIKFAKENGKILPIACANGNLPNAEHHVNHILHTVEFGKNENVREFHENDAHWSCDLHSAVLYGKLDGEFTGESLYRMLEARAYEQVFADLDMLNRPWGKDIHLANSAAQFRLDGF